MTTQSKIIVLWGLFLLGMVFHSLIGLMPLFFGESVAIAESTGKMPDSMAYMSLTFYLLPMVCIIVSLYTASQWHRVMNLIVATGFASASIFHLVAEVSSGVVQVILLTFVFIVTAILAWTSYNWVREK